MRNTFCLALLAILIHAPGATAEQGAAAPGPPIATTTRLVAQFSELEQKLGSAIEGRDAATLDKLLSDDFEQWTPAPPGEPIPREQWMHNALDGGFVLQSFAVRQMAVRTVDKTAVVSFVQSQSGVCNGRACSFTSFVVDLWQTRNGSPLLLVRYSSEVAPGAHRAPKPTGRE